MRKYIKQLLPGISISFIMSFMLAIFEPLVLYFTNIEEFSYSFFILFPIQFWGFVILFFISLVILFVVMIEVTNANARLDIEYKGIYVTPAEFRAGVGRDKVDAARFSENVKCEIDAD